MLSDKPQPRFAIQSFFWSAGDRLAAEHELLSKVVSEFATRDWQFETIDLQATEAGRQILSKDALALTRTIAALVEQTSYWDKLGAKSRVLAQTEMERINWHHHPEWEHIWPRRMVCFGILRQLMRRKLPFGREHLIQFADWIADADWISDSFFPVKSFVKAVESYGLISRQDSALQASIMKLAKLLRQQHGKECPQLAQRIEKALEMSINESEKPSVADSGVALSAATRSSSPAPAEVGNPNVLVQLKRFLGIVEIQESIQKEEMGLDHFSLRSDSPLRQEHEIINSLLPEVVERPGYPDPDLGRTEAGQAMLSRNAEGRARIVLALAERCVNTHFVRGGGLADHRCWQSQYAIHGVFKRMMDANPKFDRNTMFDLLLYLSAMGGYHRAAHVGLVEMLLAQVEQQATRGPFTTGERYVLHRLRCRFVRACPFGRPNDEVLRLNRLLGDNPFMALVPGEAWSDDVNAVLEAMSSVARDPWLKMLQHATTASGSRPSGKWVKVAKVCLTKISEKEFSAALQRWLHLLDAARSVPLLADSWLACSANPTIDDQNASCLRGLLWVSPQVASAELIRAVGGAAVSCYRKVPGIGPRAVKVGNAAVFALSQINDPLAAGQLALLKAKVKFGSAQKEIEKAFSLAAAVSGLPREELEEMAVPAYGLTEIGRCVERFGEFIAELRVTGTTSVEIAWFKAGKPGKSVPAAVKQSHGDDLKELQAAAKDIQRMLPAQRERLDSLFLQQREWPLAVWRERYLEHPLVGVLARRLIWEFTTAGKTTAGIWFCQERRPPARREAGESDLKRAGSATGAPAANGALVDLDLRPIATLGEGTTVRLWHPIGKDVDEIVAWRAWLDEQQIQQPFKQAHREVYLLTDAERRTRTYSNRFAAHILKQHQFNALAALRGWKNKLRLMVDAEYPPATLPLPRWNLRAEFWIESVGDTAGTDTNESGVYLRVATDQVRFYRAQAAPVTAHAGGGGFAPGHGQTPEEPLPLEEIPPLVFSEVMRDVDLFVGVASVGNDPAWSDGGPEGRYREYWHSYSFGELSATAQTRRAILERLVPKLKIAGQCSFDDKFLVVRGRLRTYRIHLGSGNILMSPNDQYLCIVPQQGVVENGKVFLPFEGDRTLSVIISKAFLLAGDAAIKDPTIVSQITGKPR